MRKALIIICSLLLVQTVQAQTWDEWWRQKKTQKKYLLQQIAALKIYIEYSKKGYEIAKGGLDFIGDVKNGEFNLHKGYFNSLKTINPEVAHYSRVAEIMALQTSILKGSSSTRKQLRQSGMLTGSQLEYVGGVLDRMLANCGELLDELSLVTTAGKLEMTDDQRLKRIDQIYVQMQDNHRFTEGFGNEARMLSASRRQEQNDIKSNRAIYGF